MTMDQKTTRLEEILNSLSGGSNTTESIKMASASLKEEFLSKPSTITMLVKIISTSQQWQVRQLASIELKKLVTLYWEDIPESERQEIRTALPNIILVEPMKPPRLSISQVVGAIALIDLPLGRWNTLLDSVAQCAAAGVSEHRECGMLLLYDLFEIIADNDPSKLSGVFNVLRNALADPTSQNVRVSSIETLTKFAEYIKPSQNEMVAAFQSVIPEIVKVLEETISRNDVDASNKILELFETALLSDVPLLYNCLQELANFMINVSINTSLDDEIRVGAITFLYWSAQYKKTRVIKLGLVDSYLKCAMRVAVEAELSDVDDQCPARSAIILVNVMATNFPAHQIFEVIGPIILEYFGHQDEGFRKAGLLTLGVAAEGCSEFLCSKVGELLPFITKSLGDSSAVVRRAACFSLYSFTDALGEEVTKYHESILPHLFQLMSDTDPEVLKNVWNAIDSFMSEIGDGAALYLPALMEKVGDFLVSLSCDLKITAIAAIGSAASSAGQAFVPYLPNFFIRLREFMTSKSDDPSELLLRAVATDSAANIASAVGKEVMMPYIQDLFDIAFEGMSIEGPHLRSSGFSLFETLSRLLGADFAPFLEPVMGHIKHTLNQDEFALKGDAASIDLENQDDEDLDLHTDISDEKEVAIDTSVELFANIGQAFLPYLEELTQLYLRFLLHFSENVRRSSFQALIRFTATLYSLFKTEDWVPGIPLRVNVDDRIGSYINAVLPTVMDKWSKETDLSVSNRVLIELDSAIQTVGPALMVGQVEAISTGLENIFKKQALCQTSDDDEDQLELEDLAEQESALIINAADVLGAMSKAIGPDFLSLFRPFFPLLLSHFKPTLPESERAMVVAVLGDILLGLQASISEYSSDLLNVFMTGLEDPSPIVRSNSAFAVGLLCFYTTQDISSQYPAIFARLSPLFRDQAINATDNACGAVCRMIKARPDSCPIDEIIPVVLNSLPLKEDHAEYVPVYECLIELIYKEHSATLTHLDRIKGLFSQMVNETPDLIPASLLHSVKQLLS